MKNLIKVILLFLSFNLMAAHPPSIEVINSYVELAQKIDVKALQRISGPWTCQFDMIHDPQSIFASANEMNEATTALQLICIKNQCDTLGERINESQQKLKDMSESDLKDFLEFRGYNDSEIEQKILQIKTAPKPTTNLNCKTGSDLMRTVAFDSCFAIPVVCQKN
jgi:hypothetical protein